MPGMFPLQCPVPATLFFGIDVVDVASSNLFPAAGSNFTLSATVRIGGLITPFLQTPPGLPFTITFFHESFGAGPEGTLGSAPGNTAVGFAASATCTNADEYPLTATVTAPASAGTYKITAVVTSTSAWPMNAYEEGPLINVR